MPTTRRSTGRTSTGGSNKAKAQQATQTKLAFHSTTGNNRISKRGAESFVNDTKSKAKVKELEDAVDLTEGTTAVAKPLSPATGPSIHTTEPVEIVLEHGLGEDDDAILSDTEEAAETEAKKVTKSQMDKYWQGKETLMGAPRVHLQHTSVAEKILREWDVDGRYGPCLGMTRTARWRRAHNLGLKPPIEVLAAILQEVRGEGKGAKGKGNEKMDLAMIDRLMKKSDGGV